MPKARVSCLGILVASLLGCHDAPTAPADVSGGPDPFEQATGQSLATGDPFEQATGHSLVTGPAGSLESAVGNATAQPACDNPVIEFVSGACADSPSREPAHASVMGTCFTPNKEAGLVMSGNTNGFVKGGALCNGTVFELGEPFVLPPVFVKADADGSFQVVVTGAECFVEALDFASCETSNALELPPVP